jgi:hypothetical protein
MSTRVRPTRVESAPLVRWGAVFSGTVTGVALAVLLGTLWAALAFASHRSLFYQHLAWWFAGTAIGATFVAGLLAGLVSATRGRLSGLANGLTTWALIVIATVAGGVPGLVAYGSTRPIVINGIRVAVTTVRPWTTFWALLSGLGAALLGGVIGGMMRQPREPSAEVEPTIDVRDQPPVPAAAPAAVAAPVAAAVAMPGSPPVSEPLPVTAPLRDAVEAAPPAVPATAAPAQPAPAPAPPTFVPPPPTAQPETGSPVRPMAAVPPPAPPPAAPPGPAPISPLRPESAPWASPGSPTDLTEPTNP